MMTNDENGKSLQARSRDVYDGRCRWIPLWQQMEDLAMPSVSEYFPCEDGVVPRKLSIRKGARKTPGHHMSTTELCSPTFHAGVTGSFSLRESALVVSWCLKKNLLRCVCECGGGQRRSIASERKFKEGRGGMEFLALFCVDYGSNLPDILQPRHGIHVRQRQLEDAPCSPNIFYCIGRFVLPLSMV